MGLFDRILGSSSESIENVDDIPGAIERGDLKPVFGSGGERVFDPDTGEEYWTDDGKPV